MCVAFTLYNAASRSPHTSVTGGRPWPDSWAGRPAAGRYGVTVTTKNMPALKWPGMLQTKR